MVGEVLQTKSQVKRGKKGFWHFFLTFPRHSLNWYISGEKCNEQNHQNTLLLKIVSCAQQVENLQRRRKNLQKKISLNCCVTAKFFLVYLLLLVFLFKDFNTRSNSIGNWETLKQGPKSNHTLLIFCLLSLYPRQSLIECYLSNVIIFLQFCNVLNNLGL